MSFISIGDGFQIKKTCNLNGILAVFRKKSM